MSYNGTQLLPGQSPPLEVITATDQRGVIIIATTLGLIFASISLLIRLYLQLEIRHQIGRDDVAVLLAMLFSIAQASAVFVEVSKGFGETMVDISSSSLLSLQKASYSGDILYLVTIWLTKCSVVFLTFRVSPDKRHNFASTTVLGAASVFVVISLFLVGLGCELSQPWLLINTQCAMKIYTRWQVVAAFDIITEIALLAVSIFLVGGLQLAKFKKFVVIFAFALRVPIIIAIVFRLHYLNLELSSADPTLKGSLASVCTQIQISYAIIAATTPCLKPFMSALSTHYGSPATFTTPSSTKKTENSYVLSNLSKSSKNTGQEKPKPIPKAGPNTRWDKAENHTSVVAGDAISFESYSSVQMIIQKNTEWDVEFEGTRRASTNLSPEAVHETFAEA